ncbi:MAG: CAP domain-containing protein [Deltaproteobacteria bacterium]
MKSPILRCSLLVALATTGCDASGPSPADDAGVGVPDAPVVVADDAFVTEPDAFDPGAGETGRMVGMTEAHNRFRAMAATDDPLPALIWDTELAAVAQAYSEELARSGCGLMHSSTGYGENLYWQRGLTVSAADVVEGWHAEIACYRYGPFMRGDACDMACTRRMNASGCGHYTQVVWRDTRRLGCGMATCSNGAEIWTCNYDPAGNYLGQEPY